MYRHSPVRNARPKGVKIKHAIQICLLVAVCFWLIFQVKRSHDKKREFNASDTRIERSEEAVKFGRKDLQPKTENTMKETENHEEEQEKDQEEQEEKKHEEEEQDDEKVEDGGDEIDENEQEKSDVDIDIEQEEVDLVDEEGVENGQSQTENMVSVDENDQDGSMRNAREAREEHYKADDASSAVTHDSPTVGTENGGPSNTSLVQEKGPPLNTTLSMGDSTTEGGVPVPSLLFNLSNVSGVENERKKTDGVEEDGIDGLRLEERTDEGGNSEDTGAE